MIPRPAWSLSHIEHRLAIIFRFKGTFSGFALSLYTLLSLVIPPHTHQIVALPLFIGVGYQLLCNQWPMEAIKSHHGAISAMRAEYVCAKHVLSFYYILITINITGITINSIRHKYQCSQIFQRGVGFHS